MQGLDPKLDVVFKMLLTRNEQLLLDMLQKVLAAQISELTVLNPEIPGELTAQKGIVLDIRVALQDGSRVDVEMQMRVDPDLVARVIYYCARDYTTQLRRGDGYETLTPTVVVLWLAEPLLDDLPLHSIFELRERTSHRLLSNHLGIHVLQLSKLDAEKDPSPEPGVHRWARFLGKDDAERERLAKEDPIMAQAKDALDQLSQDPEAQRLALERADALKLYNISLNTARKEGREEGQRATLLRLLTLKFGDLTPAQTAQVEAAGPTELEQYLERVLTADSVAAVLGG